MPTASCADVESSGRRLLTPPPPLARLRLDRGGPPAATRRRLNEFVNQGSIQVVWVRPTDNDVGERCGLDVSFEMDELVRSGSTLKVALAARPLHEHLMGPPKQLLV